MALSAADDARRETIKNLRAEANVMRESAYLDKMQKSRAKIAECEGERQQLDDDRELIEEIKRQIANLTNVSQQALEKRVKQEVGNTTAKLTCDALCQNGGGNCTSVGGGDVDTFVCKCLPGYSGKFCEKTIDWCSTNPCQNGGNCANEVTGFTCFCAPGWSGPRCETNIDECEHNPCGDHGQCTEDLNSYTCECDPGYGGVKCEIIEENVNEGCRPSNPCKNGGLCIQDAAGYSCTCPSGFSGFDCETKVDPCASLPCKNGGTCTSDGTNYVCACPAGISGLQCEIAPVACPPGATCKWCITQPGLCTKVHWTFPEKSSRAECSARCEAAESIDGWGCESFTYWRGHCWLCEPPGTALVSSSPGMEFYQKVEDFAERRCVEGGYKAGLRKL